MNYELKEAIQGYLDQHYREHEQRNNWGEYCDDAPGQDCQVAEIWVAAWDDALDEAETLRER